MRLNTKLGGCLIAAAVILGGVPPQSAAAAPHTSAAAATSEVTAAAAGAVAKGSAFRGVTLITGDHLRVATDGSNKLSIEPGKGRANIGFLQRTVRGHLTVLPSDALPMVNAGRLDPRLFDVTALLAAGYDDSHKAGMPLIITAGGGGSTGKLSARSVSGVVGATVVRDLPAVNGVAVTESRTDAGAFWASVTTPAAGTASAAASARALTSGASRIWLDGIRQPTLDVSVPLIGAPTAWAAGQTGEGVRVAVVDTGIDASHPDLVGKVVAEQDFTGSDARDSVGHGTHVASTITGSGAASNGKYRGVAPGVQLYDAKVCEENGCTESAILAGMQWAAAEQHAKVVNMSLGGEDTPGIDPLEQAIQTLTEQYGTLFVVAAGNSGNDGTVGSPASADDALAVGAVTKTDELADFSSRGPRIGDSALKPDITAPGVNITAARGKDGFLGTPGQPYMTISGTSMATPHVTGSAAIVAGEHPDWTPAQIKAALMASAKPNPAIGVFAQGAGRVDVGRAIQQTVTTAPASVSFGQQQWPHTDDSAVTHTVTYHNDAKADVTLALALHVNGPDGKPATPGMFSVSATTVTVPAGGDASVTVTADTRVDGPDGYTGGDLTATGAGAAAGVVVHTPVAVDKEVESYDITINHLDRAGQLTGNYNTLLVGLDKTRFTFGYDPSGTLKLRVPKGRYLVSTFVAGVDPKRPDFNLLVQPSLDVNAAQTVTMDARLAKSSSITVPRSDAKVVLADISCTMQTAQFGFGSTVLSDGFDNLYSAQIGTAGPVNGFSSSIDAQFGQVQADHPVVNSPYAYLLSYFTKGSLITDVHRAVADRDLASVQVDIAAPTTGASAERFAFGRLPTGESGGWAAGFRYDTPNSHTEYYNTDGGVQWEAELLETLPSTDPKDPFPQIIDDLSSSPTQYRAGQQYHETWNQAVFGPVTPPRSYPGAWAARLSDRLLLGVPIYGDGAGRAGWSMTQTAHITVSKDGTTVAEGNDLGGSFPVPAQAGRYRVEIAATRAAPFTLSTQSTVAWTFGSSHVTGDAPQALPLSVIRFTPRLDLLNRAPKERMLTIPIAVDRQPGSAAGRLRSLKAEVSFDDGKTWQALAMDRKADGGVVKVKYPTGTGFVSVRASATDTKNNTVEETIIRAFRYDG